MPDSIAIVIPCMNEAKNLKLLLPRVFEVVKTLPLPGEVYVVNGPSNDDTARVAEELGARVIEQRGMGYGGATKTAIEEIHHTFIITLDADYSHHPAILKYLVEARHEADIVIASRYVNQGFAKMPRMRSFMSRVLNVVFRRALSLNVRDLSSGYRLYRRAAIAKLRLESNTYAILQEMLVKAYCEGYSVKEIPFHYLPRRHGTTHARLFHFGKDYLSVLPRMWSLRNSVESADYDTRAFNSAIWFQRWWQRRRYDIILEFIGDHLRVFDAGCGSTQIMNGAPQIVGMDILARKLRFMRRPGRKLVNGSTFALPFKDAAFEVVISSQVIEHIPEEEVIFKELDRCLEPGGVLILGTPDYGSWQWPLIEKCYGLAKPTGYADEHITHYTREGLFARLETMGYVIEAHRYILRGELIIKARKPTGA